MKKTKKEKMIADLRKKNAFVQTQAKSTFQAIIPSDSKINLPNKNFSVVFERVNKDNVIDYSQISRDLKKTIFVSLLIISLLIFSKFLLRV